MLNINKSVNAALLETHDTYIVMDKSVLRRTVENASGEGSAHSAERGVTLMVRGMVERVRLAENEPVIIGRADMKANHKPDVDLSPYGATRRGVSRSHVRLVMEDGLLFATDLGSQNGSFRGAERLVANQPYQLRSGDTLLLGTLSVQVIFGDDEL